MSDREELKKELIDDDQENDQVNNNTGEIDPADYQQRETIDPEINNEIETNQRDNAQSIERLIRIIAFQTRTGLPDDLKDRYTELLVEETKPFLELIDFESASITEMIGYLGEKERLILGFGYIIYEAVKLKRTIKKDIKKEIKKQVENEYDRRENDKNIKGENNNE